MDLSWTTCQLWQKLFVDELCDEIFPDLIVIISDMCFQLITSTKYTTDGSDAKIIGV